MMITNILIWNSWGVGGKSFVRLIMDMKKRYRFNFLELLEPRQKSEKAEMIAKRLSFKCMEVVQAVGFSGGIWCLWDEELDFSVTYKHQQVMHGVFNLGKPDAWDLSIVYGHPKQHLRRALWQQLRAIKEACANKWCILRRI